MNRVLIIFVFILSFSVSGWGQGTVIRVGAFPNITHPQAMVGKANGWFEKALGSNAKIDWKSFNAGPSAIEALFSGAIDMTYIGPNPAITGYVRSQGEALRIVAGATSGGASLVVRNDSGIDKPEDFHGKKVASPQMGNTQDVALRAWLKAHGMKSADKGGDVQVIPLANPDQLTLFLKKELDAAFGRLQVTYDPLRYSLLTSARSAYDAGFLGRQMPDLSGMYDLSLLNQVLAEKGKKGIQ